MKKRTWHTSSHWYNLIARWPTMAETSCLSVGGSRKLTLNISVAAEQTPEAYIQLHYISRPKQNETIHRNADSCCMVSCLSLRPSLTPRPPCWKYNGVQNFSSHPPVLVFVVLFLVFGGIRVPGEPLFVEGDDHLRTLDVGLLRRHQVGFIWVFPTQSENSNSDHFPTRQTLSISAGWTNHFMRNMSSPVESVAPMILSGTSPRAKPLSFSGCESDNTKSAQIQTQLLSCPNGIDEVETCWLCRGQKLLILWWVEIIRT